MGRDRETIHGPKKLRRPLGRKNNGIKSKPAALSIAQRSFMVTKTSTASMQLSSQGEVTPNPKNDGGYSQYNVPSTLHTCD